MKHLPAKDHTKGSEMTYDWYFKAMETGNGRQLSREQQTALGVTHEPQPGFYRRRNKSGQDIPVAIWPGDDGLVAVAGGAPADPSEIWTWCCQWPVSEKVWRDVAEAGKPWPDDPPAAEAAIGHNSGSSDPLEALRIEYEGEKELAETFLKSAIETQDQADQAAVWSKKLSAIAKKATDLHRVEKQPALDECRRIDDKWRPLKDEPADLSKRLKRHLDTWLTTQARIEQERQRKAAEEAEAKRRAAEEAAKASQDNDEAKAEAERLAKEAEQAERDAQARNSSAGRTGAKVALRTFVSARIVDYDKAHMALKDHPEMKALVETLANRAVRAGVDVAGVEKVEEKRAA